MSLALRELQQAFVRSTYADDGADLDARIDDAGLSSKARLGIYRRNTVTNLCNALKADYPVVERLVGEEFFAHAAQTYIAGMPSSSGDLNDYGASFANFLETFPPARALPYLGDVARLELAWKQAFFAAEAVVADMSMLAVVTAEEWGALRFNPHPSLVLFSSPYPVLRIWCANQPDALAQEIRLDAGGEWVALWRSGTEVEMQSVPCAEYEWLAALSAGRSLADAVDAAFSIQEDFSLTECLQRHIERGSFAACAFGEKS